MTSLATFHSPRYIIFSHPRYSAVMSISQIPALPTTCSTRLRSKHSHRPTCSIHILARETCRNVFPEDIDPHASDRDDSIKFCLTRSPAPSLIGGRARVLPSVGTLYPATYTIHQINKICAHREAFRLLSSKRIRLPGLP